MLDAFPNGIPLVPDLILDFGATFRSLECVALTAGLQHVGDRYLDQENTCLLEPLHARGRDRVVAPGRLRFTVSGRNPFDERHFQGGDTSTAGSVEVGTPRQLVLAVALTHD